MIFRKDLYDAIKHFAKKNVIRFYMPGHNGGAGLSPRLKRDFFRLDVTEFDETDDLQHPQTVLKQAQEYAAQTFGAKKTFFLTCGSTTGVEAMILGSCRRGDSLLVDRNCHRSVISALILGGITPVFIYPDWDAKCCVWRGYTADMLEAALKDNPDCVGAIITSPTYYGVCSDIKGIADVLHASGKFLLVDEAHGAHFAFSELLPETALSQGADACVQSLHKTLPAIGQSAFLHIGSESYISSADIERSLRLLHTTSPSYPMMTGIDEVVKDLQSKGAKHIDALAQKCGEIKTKIRIANRLTLADESALGAEQDTMRLVIGFEKIGLSGRYAAKILREKYGIYSEMADFYHVVFIVSAGNSEKELDLLETALEEICTEQPPQTELETADLFLPRIELAAQPAAAFYAKRERIDIDKAQDRICAELIASCPPGAAAAIPGQRLTQDVLRYLAQQEGLNSVEVIVK